MFKFPASGRLAITEARKIRLSGLFFVRTIFKNSLICVLNLFKFAEIQINMHSVDFPGSNLELVKPKDWKDENCTSMRAFHSRNELGPFFLTAWQPNKEDLDAMNRGEPLFLLQYGSAFTPTSLYTMDEEGKPNV